MFKSVKIKLLPLCICLALTGVLFIAAVNLQSPALTNVNGEIQNNVTVDVPIIMYHAVSDVTSIQGDYVISSAEFENDLSYLKDNGYTAVFVSDIVKFVNGGEPLPEKPIVITFDDGYYNNYLYVYPLIKKYNFKACISPVAYFSELYTESGEVSECYSHCTWKQLREMSESGYIELGNHSYNYHKYDGTQNGIGQMVGESDENYRKRIGEDLKTAQDMIFTNTGVECKFIAYPFGIYNDNTDSLVKELGFNAALTCSSGVNILVQGDVNQLFSLKRLIRPHNKSLWEILSAYN